MVACTAALCAVTDCSALNRANSGFTKVWDPTFNFEKPHKWIVAMRAKTDVRIVQWDYSKFHKLIETNSNMVLVGLT